ncbi:MULTISPECIES: GNAT family N-acetyltransferase [unclassified Bosea (in: a-proteobacteria)]|uniref:GNAT family N-acetyltransferase n=1 Tax=unclassified Bosea (in: a-proteobacteria) TaxID=2653178 RepID=UPI00125FFDFB|nr:MULTISPECIES: GNAT family N-acetyltransferase [unclassified Bosea (in: a-proteobacteria)]
MDEANPLDRMDRQSGTVWRGDQTSRLPRSSGAVRGHPAPRLDQAERLESEIVTASDFARYQDDWDDLVRRALIPNVYMHPAVALAAERHGGRPVIVALAWRISGLRRVLVGAWLLGEFAERRGFFKVLDTALNRLVFAGTPVVDASLAPDVLDKLLDAIADQPNLPGTIVASDLNADERLLPCLRDVLARRRSRAMVVGRRRRAILTRQADGEISGHQEASAKQRQSFRRRSRRLAEAGIEPVALARGSEIAEAFRAFLEIEASGWKGRMEHSGWAIRLDPALEPFATEMIDGLVRAGCASIEGLRQGERWIAFSIWLRSGSRAFGWKMAYDEAFASFGPGRQLSEQVTATFLSDPALASFDSCNGSETSFHAAIWPERLELVDIVIDARRGGSVSGTLFMIVELAYRRGRSWLKAARDTVRASWRGLRPGK